MDDIPRPLLQRLISFPKQPKGPCRHNPCFCGEAPAYAITNKSRYYHILYLDLSHLTDTGEYLGDIDGDRSPMPGRFDVGTWRLPPTRGACAAFLWKFWELPALGRDRTEVPDRHVVREMGDVIMRRRKECSRELVTYRNNKIRNASLSQDPDANDDPDFDIGDPTGTTLVSAWLAIRNKQLVLSFVTPFIWWEELIVERTGGYNGVEGRMDGLKKRKWANDLRSLEQSIVAADACRKEGNNYYRAGNHFRACWHYLEGVHWLAPWYPSECWLPEWESTLTGLTHITFALSINLALGCYHQAFYSIALQACLSVIRHPFATNRITAKAWHIFLLNINAVIKDFARSGTTPPLYYTNQQCLAVHQKEYHLKQPPDEVASPSEAGDFTVDHAIEGAATLLGDFEGNPDGAESWVPREMRFWQSTERGAPHMSFPIPAPVDDAQIRKRRKGPLAKKGGSSSSDMGEIAEEDEDEESEEEEDEEEDDVELEDTDY